MKTTPLPSVVHATCVTDEELAQEQLLSEILSTLEFHIEFEEKQANEQNWSDEWTVGYIEGIKRALYLVQNRES